MGILNDMLKDVFDISKIKDAVSELKKMDTLLTRISRTNERLSRSDLAGLGSRALRAAGRYGMDAADYLAAFQEASRAGYEDAEGMAELSMAAQNAGSITAELADRLLSATDQAYRMGGSVSELTKVLDGLDRISGRNALDMAELSEGMAGLGSTAASLGVDASQAAAYSRLEEDDTRKSRLPDSLGDSASAEGLDALLSRWDTYRPCCSSMPTVPAPWRRTRKRPQTPGKAP